VPTTLDVALGEFSGIEGDLMAAMDDASPAKPVGAIGTSLDATPTGSKDVSKDASLALAGHLVPMHGV